MLYDLLLNPANNADAVVTRAQNSGILRLKFPAADRAKHTLANDTPDIPGHAENLNQTGLSPLRANIGKVPVVCVRQQYMEQLNILCGFCGWSWVDDI